MCSRKGRTVENPWTSILFSSLFCFLQFFPYHALPPTFMYFVVTVLHFLATLYSQMNCPTASIKYWWSIPGVQCNTLRHIVYQSRYSYIHSKQVSSQFTQWQAWIQIFAEFTDTNPPGHIWWFCAKIRWDQSRSSSANYLQESRCQAFFAGIHSLAFSC